MTTERARKLPLRTCVACRTARPKRELVRIVRAPSGEVMLDNSGRAAGRGAYLCADGACWPQALRKSAIERALSTPLPAALRAQLEQGQPVTGEGAHGT
ncbi:MAG TPA: YlxR family protein [Candidatus Limnocylindrales bacterium]